MGSGLCGAGPIVPDDGWRSGVHDIEASNLLVRSQARHFAANTVIDEHSHTGNECLFMLECCRHVPLRPAPTTTLDCSASAAGTCKGNPFVQARVQLGDGATLGSVLRWPVRYQAESPTWFSARPLGVGPGDSRASLHLSLMDGDTLLGSLSRPLPDLAGGPLTLELAMRAGREADKPTTVSFQVLEAAALFKTRTVFLIRHGESTWNAAQSRGDLAEMARTTDHGLSTRGRQQAEALRRRLEAAAARRDAHAAELRRATVCYASPLTRAIQTAVIAVGPMVASGAGELTLMPNAREKQNIGGRDSMSTKLGSEILQHTYEELWALYGAAGKADGGILQTFGRLHFDTSEVEEQWWCEGLSDSAEDLQLRMQEFVAQLLYTAHDTTIVVGHSHFFRSFLKSFMSPEFQASNKKLARDLSTMKVMNCGVVRLELDPRRGVLGGPIVNAELVFDTTLDGEGALGACCVTPGHAGDDTTNTLLVEDGTEPPAKAQ